ncbi:hypothetical protein [Mesorhizobium sp. Pch-S]|uniref:hypothetical protein n=1 Tax=Mesorhizobium sp. Pch-S TaxID=2082387 RepID=UPI001012148B|nr:hypothetical protein [Mesorhizobium sp. Pch-S]QAZ46755.1 hypothetical protein C1M53_31370 [Mesorhizobium sp. Pch-S]
MQKPIATKGEICPFHQKDVSKVCHRCPLFVLVRGTDSNSGKEVDEWGCSFAWTPVLMIENANQSRQTGAAVESFRNEMVRANGTGQKLMALQSMRNIAMLPGNGE